MKAYTDLEQSKKLAEILPIESADMWWAERYRGHTTKDYQFIVDDTPYYYLSLTKPSDGNYSLDTIKDIPCWSLAALFSLIKDKCGYFEFVYLKRTYDGRANPLDDVYRLSTDEYDVYNKEERIIA